MRKTTIIYTMDNNYAMQAAVSLTSLFVNNKELKFHVCILSDKISEINKARLKSLIESYNHDVTIIEMPDLSEYSNFDFTTYGWVKASYIRLFLCGLLPDSIERLLYIDPDTMIINSIDYLINVLYSDKFSSYYAGACQDSIALYKRFHGFKKNEKYYNTGVMLINLALWREENLEKVFLKEIIRRKGKSIDVDQSYINCVMINKILLLPAKYNVMPLYYMSFGDYLKKSGYSNKEIYCEEELKEAVSNPCIIHFAGDPEFRPWYLSCKHVLTEKWIKYLDMTEWKEYKPVERKTKKGKSRSLKADIVTQVLKVPFLARLYTMKRFGFWVKIYR